MIISTRKAEQMFDEVADISRQMSSTDSGRKFGAEDLAAQGVATIGMGRTPIGIVPRRAAAIAKFVVGMVPGPEFHQRVNPEIQMVDGQIAPDVPHLLLARAPNFLHVIPGQYRDFAGSCPDISEKIQNLAKPHSGSGLLMFILPFPSAGANTDCRS
jgi:hypothetical protein